MSSLNLDQLKQFLGQHLGPRHAQHVAMPVRVFTEKEKVELASGIFYLIPERGVFRSSPHDPIKPLIRSHLSSLGLLVDEVIVDIIKELCDNICQTTPRSLTKSYGSLRKCGISDVRQKRKIYEELKNRQNNRCLVCGIIFGGDTVETLDHVIPWRLGGDPGNGANWQLLCAACNSAKGFYISSRMLPEYHNWYYLDVDDGLDDATRFGVSNRIRYVVLTEYPVCEQEGCNRTSFDDELHVVPRSQSGLRIFGHLTTRCSIHAK